MIPTVVLLLIEILLKKYMSDLNGGIQLADKLEKMIPQYNMDNISSLTVVEKRI